MAGLESSTNDTCIFKDKLFNYDFDIPDKKYCLADAGYHNTHYYLYPNKNNKYYLKKQISIMQKLYIKEELFNIWYFNL